MTATPTPITSATVRRHLDGVGPSVATTLAALAAGEHATARPPLPLVEQVETIKRRALEAGAQEAAWLLYMGARSCLFSIETFARDIECEGGPAGSPRRFEGQYSRLANRLDGLNRSLPSWAHVNPTAVPAQLALECLDWAEAIRPGWEWIPLKRGMVAMSRGDWAIGLDMSLRAKSASKEEVLYVAALRNALDCSVQAGCMPEHQDLIDAYEARRTQDRLAAAFRINLAAAQGDARSFRSHSQVFQEREDNRGASYWLHFLAHHGPAWEQSLGATAQAVVLELKDHFG